MDNASHGVHIFRGTVTYGGKTFTMASTALEIFNEHGGKLDGEEMVGLLMANILPHCQAP